MAKPTEKQIYEKLGEIEDPELFIDVVNLGLIYEIKISDKEIEIKMTLTTPACPLAPWFREQVVEKLRKFGLKVKVEFTFDPLWSPDKMSEDARISLGMI